jgi:hypothetical protein
MYVNYVRSGTTEHARALTEGCTSTISSCGIWQLALDVMGTGFAARLIARVTDHLYMARLGLQVVSGRFIVAGRAA